MTPQEFDTAADTTRLTPLIRALARRMLIDGENGADIARDAGVPRQQVYRAAHRVKEAAGLVTLAAVVPAEHQVALLAWLKQRGGWIE